MARKKVPDTLDFLCLLSLSLVLLSAAAPARADDDPLRTTPPPEPVRLPAEWEPMQAVIVASATTELGDLMRYFTEDVKLIILGTEAGLDEWTRNNLLKSGVNMDHCEYCQVQYTPIVRDGLPWLLFTDHNEAAFVYNQPPTGNWAIPQYGLEQGYTVYRSGLELHGGDFMTDGQGTAVSLDDTAIRHAPMGDEFMERVRDYWGVHTYHFIANQAFGSGGYAHTDCLAKFLAPDTILVTRVPASDSLHERFEEAAAYFQRQVSCYGTPYKVVRVDSPEREPYTNSLIVNRRVFVPILDHPADAAALATYEATMPGYEVIGIRNPVPGRDESTWMSCWALHCDTMGIADEQMLYIEHVPVLDRPPTPQGFPIAARVVAYSGAEFVEGTPAVLWRAPADVNESQPSASWNTTPMVLDSESGDGRYLAWIPAQPVGTVVQYYIRAKDASGRDETHPRIGRPQAHTFTVTALGANVSAVSAGRGGTVEVYMNAGLDNAGQSYHLAYSLCTDSEAVEDPQAELPSTTTFAGFDGALDDFGSAVARMTISEPLASAWVGGSLRFSLELTDRQNIELDAVCIQVLE